MQVGVAPTLAEMSLRFYPCDGGTSLLRLRIFSFWLDKTNTVAVRVVFVPISGWHCGACQGCHSAIAMLDAYDNSLLATKLS